MAAFVKSLSTEFALFAHSSPLTLATLISSLKAAYSRIRPFGAVHSQNLAPTWFMILPGAKARDFSPVEPGYAQYKLFVN
jgi:hypothetical protein